MATKNMYLDIEKLLKNVDIEYQRHEKNGKPYYSIDKVCAIVIMAIERIANKYAHTTGYLCRKEHPNQVVMLILPDTDKD